MALGYWIAVALCVAGIASALVEPSKQQVPSLSPQTLEEWRTAATECHALLNEFREAAGHLRTITNACVSNCPAAYWVNEPGVYEAGQWFLEHATEHTLP